MANIYWCLFYLRRDTSLKLWIKSPQQEFKSLGGHDGTITALAFMKDKEHERYPPAISGSFDCSFKTWNLEKGEINVCVLTEVDCSSSISPGTDIHDVIFRLTLQRDGYSFLTYLFVVCKTRGGL